MRIVFGLVMLAALTGAASAQGTGTFYGPQGQYQGSYNRFGNTTTYYGPMGQYQGQSQTFGNTTTIYGPMGQYQGQVQRPMQMPRMPSLGGW